MNTREQRYFERKLQNKQESGVIELTTFIQMLIMFFETCDIIFWHKKHQQLITLINKFFVRIFCQAYMKDFSMCSEITL